MANIDCLTTVIKNNTSGELHLSFIPPHGIKLGAGQTYTVTGSLIDAIRANFKSWKRKLAALKKAVESNKVYIVMTPASVFQDNLGNPKVVAVDALGALTTADACSATP